MKTNKTFVMRESDIRKMKRDIIKDVTKTAIYVFLAWLKDTEYIDNDADKLRAEYERLDSWFEAIDEHLISVKDIRNIIENSIDAEIGLK